jgi:TolB-like protein/DNA-binding winged helix-turn-helix (wHTH) protein
MASRPDHPLYEFAGFRVDTTQRRLLDASGEVVPLSSRAFDVLVQLVRHGGELLDKGKLLAAVWPGTVVEEGSLTQCIFTLRRALGDTADQHRFIATIPGRGYQFVAPVRVLDETAAAPGEGSTPRLKARLVSFATFAIGAMALVAFAWRGIGFDDDGRPAASVPPAVEIAPNSIAVMPFADLTSGGEMEYFADGIAEELMSTLAKSDKLRVIGRRSVFALKGSTDDAITIGAKLRVAYLLEGSVRMDGQRLRISTQLTRTADGMSLWTQTYERQFGDVLDLQGSIAQEVVSALGKSVLPLGSPWLAADDMRNTRNPAAYHSYLRGRYFFGRRTAADLARAAQEFGRATQLDPGFALGHAWLGRAFAQLSARGLGDVAQYEARASESFTTALNLEPMLVKLWWIRLRDPTLRLDVRAIDLESALAADPYDGEAITQLVNVYYAMGRRSEALQRMRQAYETDPLYPSSVSFLSLVEYVFNSDDRRALELADEMRALAPADPRGHTLRAWVHFTQGRASDWDAEMAEAIRVAPRDSSTHRMLGIDYAEFGLRDAALHHARVALRIAPENAAHRYIAAKTELVAGNLPEARAIVASALRELPGDHQTQLARAELEYFSDDCAAAVPSLLIALPKLAQPEAALDVMLDAPNTPILVWCLRKLGSQVRATEIARVVNRCLADPIKPGTYDAVLARLAAATGDRAGLLRHLRRLDESRSMHPTFVRHEPMIKPWLDDREVLEMLERIDARRAAWRRGLPLAPTKVPIPDPPAT